MTQRNHYKGNPEHAWVRLRFAASDGSTHERELLADTGSPCAIILNTRIWPFCHAQRQRVFRAILAG